VKYLKGKRGKTRPGYFSGKVAEKGSLLFPSKIDKRESGILTIMKNPPILNVMWGERK